MGTSSLGHFYAPDLLTSHFHIRPGDVVADYGAGDGRYVPALAKAVGPEGKVMACEIQRPLVERIGTKARATEGGAVEVMWCDIEKEHGVPVADETVDIGLAINTFHQCDSKENAARELRRTIRKGGVLHVVDWSDSFAGLGPTPEQVVAKDDMIAWCEANGFLLEREQPAGDFHYQLVFRAV